MFRIFSKQKMAHPLLYATGTVIPAYLFKSASNEEIVKNPQRIKNELGISIVMQVFPQDSDLNDWQRFLDITQSHNMQAIIWFGNEGAPIWTGNSFDLGLAKEFLKSMQNHPALYAHFLIDEPFHRKHNWEVTTERLQQLYSQVKEIAPNVSMIVQFSREIAFGEAKNDQRYRFKAGQADIVGISALEFRRINGKEIYQKRDMIRAHMLSRKAIKREQPDAQIWSSVQVFGSPRSTYYMPTLDELKDLTNTILSNDLEQYGRVTGLMFQTWRSFDSNDAQQQNLSKPEFVDIRRFIKEIYA